MRRIGILLSGCGLHDGSDVQETVLVVLAARRRGFRPIYFAPDVEQRTVVDHTSGTIDADAAPRRVLAETARVARGVVQTVGEMRPSDLDALVIPGGAGAVDNLCDPGDRPLGGGPLRAEVAALLDELATRRAPVGAIGLARVVVARHRDEPLDDAPVSIPAGEVVVDEAGRFVFTPGFMGSDDLLQVTEGIDRMIEALARMLAPVGETGRR
ncbi:MAG: hypothetical protein R3344_00695 [Acidobacteriota bacterium]|nr:hypothetical protein [Acidobacteriota bacterium]